ncbi:FecR family protein [Gaoshiqia sp. Z1-71]|uniref:FecR family protein n=1 Tax=Gaoshiqia hydrogeniformans TaxID=3290090 RepID=UPI003BF89DA3
MDKKTENQLFNNKFKNGVSRQSIKDYRTIKQRDQESALAILIAYILKFKRKDNPAPEAGIPDFSEIRAKSLTLFRLHSSGKHSNIRYFRIAAAASIIVLFALGGYWLGLNQIFSGTNTHADLIEFNTPKGQQSELILPDGTFVALNYDSKLKYHISPGKKLQEVELDGEAFFKVTKNHERIFRVITDNMSINVLGTEFNVKAYCSDQKTETTLLEGSIEIKDIPGEKNSVILKPGERWSYDKIENLQSVTGVDSRLSTLWRNGEYYFDKVSFGELAKTLERMYKVSIFFQNPELEKEIYSGSIYQDEEIDRFLEVINLTIPITVKKENNKLWINKK